MCVVDLASKIEKLAGKYVWITPEQRLLTSLWTLHTYVYDRYTFTPRLALLSPVYGCGKTTFMILIEQLAYNPIRLILPTPATLFRIMDAEPSTILVDEGDNLNFAHDKTLRGVLNGNRRGDKIPRVTPNGVRFYNTFTPVGLAAVGRLPNALMQRSIIVDMIKYPADLPSLASLDENDMGLRTMTEGYRGEAMEWAENCQLKPNPPNNPIRNRLADNWRPIFSIADDFGRGAEARAAAIKMTAGLPDDDKKVFLLMDIRDVFDDLGADRVWTKPERSPANSRLKRATPKVYWKACIRSPRIKCIKFGLVLGPL
jgi:hypothetical protein